MNLRNYTMGKNEPNKEERAKVKSYLGFQKLFPTFLLSAVLFLVRPNEYVKTSVIKMLLV